MLNKDSVIVVTISTVIGALLIAVFSPVFSPFSESIKDGLTGEPNSTVISAMTFDRDKKEVTKPVSNGDTISSDSIRFDFNASQKAPFRGQPPNPSSFQCSLDGSPFEDCVSPKSYGELPTEVGHTFQVRAIGILGNIDKSPHKFYFTTITSANIEGVIKRNGTPEVDAPIALHYNLTQITKSLELTRSLNNITLDSDPNLRTTKTDSKGRFQFEGLGQGTQYFVINSTLEKKPYKDYLFVPAGEQLKEYDFEIMDMSAITLKPLDGIIADPEANNPDFKDSLSTVQSQDFDIALAQESKLTQQGPNEFSTRIWLDASESVLSNIQNASYYLHPTFNPNVITSYTMENRFIISFTNWGIFDLKAKVFFKDGIVQDLELPMEEWIVS
jgi:hypothetical protein